LMALASVLSSSGWVELRSENKMSNEIRAVLYLVSLSIS